MITRARGHGVGEVPWPLGLGLVMGDANEKFAARLGAKQSAGHHTTGSRTGIIAGYRENGKPEVYFAWRGRNQPRHLHTSVVSWGQDSARRA